MDEPDALTTASKRPSGEIISESLMAEVRDMIYHKDPIRCQWWVEWAAQQPAEAAIPALCHLLQPPKGFWKRWWGRGDAWSQVRAEVVNTLASFGNPETIPVLIYSLLNDPDSKVRQNAAQALHSFGRQASSPMLAQLRIAENWSLLGMEELIRTVGDAKDPQSGPTLLRVLNGDLPLSPARWVKRPVFWSALASLSVSLPPLIAILSWTSEVGLDLRALLALLVLYFPFCLILFYLFLFYPLGMVAQRKERHNLFAAAADSLIVLQDKRALPGLIQIGFGHHPNRARAEAQRAVHSLLPLLGPEDRELLQADHERHLMEALGTVDADMTLRIVRALEFVGTGKAVRSVESLLRRASTRTVLRAEAERVLPLLQARLQQEQAVQVLLRPSQIPQNTSEEMLRPVLEPIPTPAEQLLRPTSDNS